MDKLMEQVLDNAPDAILLSDKEGIIRSGRRRTSFLLPRAMGQSSI
jgi:hypothetical protein